MPRNTPVAGSKLTPAGKDPEARDRVGFGKPDAATTNSPVPPFSKVIVLALVKAGTLERLIFSV